MRPFTLSCLVLASAGVWAAGPAVYPVTYSGGVSRIIFTDLTLLDAQTYTQGLRIKIERVLLLHLVPFHAHL